MPTIDLTHAEFAVLQQQLTTMVGFARQYLPTVEELGVEGKMHVEGMTRLPGQFLLGDPYDDKRESDELVETWTDGFKLLEALGRKFNVE